MLTNPRQGSVASSGGVEKLDDRRRKARECTEKSNRWLISRQEGFIDRYLRGELNIGLRRVLGDQANLGFVISVNDVSGGKPGQLDAHTANLKTGGADDEIEQLFMLSLNVELMKQPKQIVPSFVRFQIFDDLPFCGGESVYEFSSFQPLGLKMGEIVGDREIMAVWPRYAMAVCQGSGKEIEGGSNTVEVGSVFSVESERNIAFCDSYKDIISGLVFRLLDSHIEVSFDPSIESLVEGWEFGYGPVDGGLSAQ